MTIPLQMTMRDGFSIFTRTLKRIRYILKRVTKRCLAVRHSEESVGESPENVRSESWYWFS